MVSLSAQCYARLVIDNSQALKGRMRMWPVVCLFALVTILKTSPQPEVPPWLRLRYRQASDLIFGMETYPRYTLGPFCSSELNKVSQLNIFISDKHFQIELKAYKSGSSESGLWLAHFRWFDHASLHTTQTLRPGANPFRIKYWRHIGLKLHTVSENSRERCVSFGED